MLSQIDTDQEQSVCWFLDSPALRLLPIYPKSCKKTQQWPQHISQVFYRSHSFWGTEKEEDLTFRSSGGSKNKCPGISKTFLALTMIGNVLFDSHRKYTECQLQQWLSKSSGQESLRNWVSISRIHVKAGHSVSVILVLP